MKKQDSRPRVRDLKLKRETVRLLTLKMADLHNVMGGGIVKSGVMLVSRCCQTDD
jgi:hypothetical protein